MPRKCLTRRGVAKLEEKCKITLQEDWNEPWDLLGVLTLARSFTKTRYLEIHIPWGRGSYKESEIQFRRVARMISKLSSVGKAVLYFEKLIDVVNLKQVVDVWELLEKKDYPRNRADAMPFCEGLGGIFNALLERGCTSLEVWCFRQDDRIFKETLGSPQRNPTSSTVKDIKTTPKNLDEKSLPLYSEPEALNTGNPKPTVLSGPTWCYRSPYGPIEPLVHLSPEARANSKLTSLTILSGWHGAMLQPPMLQWTYDVLSLPSLTTLILNGIDVSSPQRWTVLAEILPRARSNVRHLTIDDVKDISPGDLSIIIDGFPSLETLSVDDVTFAHDDSGTGRYDKHGNFLCTRFPGSAEFTFAYPQWMHLRELRMHTQWIIDPPQLSRVLSESAMALERFTVVIKDKEWKILMGFRPFSTWSSAGIQGLKMIFTHFAEVQPLRFQVNVEIYLPKNHPVEWMKGVGKITGTQLSNIQTWSRVITGVILVAERRFLVPGDTASSTIWESVGRWFTDILPGLQRVEFKKGNTRDQRTLVSLRAFLCRWAIREVLQGMESVKLNGERWQW